VCGVHERANAAFSQIVIDVMVRHQHEPEQLHLLAPQLSCQRPVAPRRRARMLRRPDLLRHLQLRRHVGDQSGGPKPPTDDPEEVLT